MHTETRHLWRPARGCTCMRALRGRRPALREAARGLAASCRRCLRSAGERTSIVRSAKLLSSTTPPMPSADPYSSDRAPANQKYFKYYDARKPFRGLMHLSLLNFIFKRRSPSESL